MGNFISTLVGLIAGGTLSTAIVYGITCAITKKEKPRKITYAVYAASFIMMSFYLETLNKVAVVIVAILFIAFGKFLFKGLSGDDSAKS